MSNAEKVAKKLAKDVGKTKGYEDGTVLKWWTTNGSWSRTFAYAAVAANGNWYTTAQAHNSYVDQVMSNDEFMRYLGDERSRIITIEVAAEFVEVDL